MPTLLTPLPQTAPFGRALVHDDGDAYGPRVPGDMTVEVALSVMDGARVGRLLLCDEDDQCTGSVTRAELSAHRGSPSYTDRLRLRDVLVFSR
ncbi:CBS domain-containing protein [Streptomyces sp. NPDC001046]|uniref:CBS domain-containing protein n=1 Tax=unclassified Streptomyces TaxID=2593676 RepID=UPI003681F6B4